MFLWRKTSKSAEFSICYRQFWFYSRKYSAIIYQCLRYNCKKRTFNQCFVSNHKNETTELHALYRSVWMKDVELRTNAYFEKEIYNLLVDWLQWQNCTILCIILCYEMIFFASSTHSLEIWKLFCFVQNIFRPLIRFSIYIYVFVCA